MQYLNFCDYNTKEGVKESTPADKTKITSHNNIYFYFHLNMHDYTNKQKPAEMNTDESGIFKLFGRNVTNNILK